MKLRVLNRIKGHLVCALAACAMMTVPVGCGSSGDGESEQEVGLEEGSGESTDGVPLNNAEGGNVAENEFLNEATAENNFDSFDNGAASETGNENTENIGNGLNDFENQEFSEENAGNETEELLTEGAGESFNNVATDPAAAENAGEDPFATGTATDQNGEVVDPFAANSTATDPFAAAAPAAADPFAAAPEATDPFAEVPADAASPAVAAEEAAPVAVPSESVSSPSSGMVPEDGSKMAYHIQVGDTLAIIAKKIYGSSGSWKTLAQENNLGDGNLIYAGDVLYYTLNSQTKGFAQSYESAPRQAVTVAAGDTLSSISARVFGTQAGWRTLWKENPQINNPDQIEVGMVLTYRAPSASASLNVPSLTEEVLAADLNL